MKIEKINNKIALTWKYKITEHHIQSKDLEIKATQHITSLNNNLIKMMNIRQILFIYKNPETQELQLTTQEPPIEANYEIIKTRNNGTQTTIQIPKNITTLTTNQTATIRYYPTEPDYYTPTQSKMTITIEKIPPEELETTAQFNTQTNPPTITWNIQNNQIPEDLQQFLTESNKKQIKTLSKAKVTLNPQTLDITITEDE